MFTLGVLGYVKGGIGWASTNVAAFVPDRVTGELADITRTVYTVGAGLEWKFAPGWSVFCEYNYLYFGTKSSNRYATGLVNPGFGPAGALADIISMRLRSQEALVGVNYRFNWAGPGVAKY